MYRHVAGKAWPSRIGAHGHRTHVKEHDCPQAQYGRSKAAREAACLSIVQGGRGGAQTRGIPAADAEVLGPGWVFRGLASFVIGSTCDRGGLEEAGLRGGRL